MASTKGDWPGYAKRGVSSSGYAQTSADTSYPKGSNKGGGDAVLAQDKSEAPRQFPGFNGKGGGGANAVQSGDKGTYPRSFPKGGGYDGSQPCDNLLNKEEPQGKL